MEQKQEHLNKLVQSDQKKYPQAKAKKKRKRQNINEQQQNQYLLSNGKGEQQNKQQNQWIVIKPKFQQLSVNVSDYSKVNKYFSHRSIQVYLRYLLAQTVPNPMWLSIRRQSQIKHILYIDLQIENSLFNYMLTNNLLDFLSPKINISNTAQFRSNSKILRQDLWQNLLAQEIQPSLNKQQVTQLSKNMNKQLLQKYNRYILSPEQLKLHLYPHKQQLIYNTYYQNNYQSKQIPIKNKILIIDCEMVSGQSGFLLGRITILNFQGQTLLDQLIHPNQQIKDYNTQYSGLTKQMLDPVTNTIQNTVYPFLQKNMTKDTILVGHSLQNDLRAMKMCHYHVIDTAVLYSKKNGIKLKLKSLAQKVLNRRIQSGFHDSHEDCLATLDLVRAKVQLQQKMPTKDYMVLREITKEGKRFAIIDRTIDKQLKDMYNPTQVVKNIKKYMRKDVAIPNLILTRIQKQQQKDWEQYYNQIDMLVKDLFQHIPKMTLIYFNCQINPSVSIVVPGSSLGLSGKSPCYFFAI